MIKLTSIDGDEVFVQPGAVNYLYAGEHRDGTATAVGIGTAQTERIWVVETPQQVAEAIVAYQGFRQDYASVSRRQMDMTFDTDAVTNYKSAVMESLIP